MQSLGQLTQLIVITRGTSSDIRAPITRSWSFSLSPGTSSSDNYALLSSNQTPSAKEKQEQLMIGYTIPKLQMLNHHQNKKLQFSGKKYWSFFSTYINIENGAFADLRKRPLHPGLPLLSGLACDRSLGASVLVVRTYLLDNVGNSTSGKVPSSELSIAKFQEGHSQLVNLQLF